MNWEESGFSIF